MVSNEMPKLKNAISSNNKNSNDKNTTKQLKKQNTMLLMLPIGDYEENKVFENFTLHADYYRVVEPAGEAFEKILTLKLNPQQHHELLDTDDNEDVIEEDKEEYEWETEYRKNKNASGFSKKEDNYYSLLGLEEEFINATQDDIRKAYKKLALIHHPDKKECSNDEEKKEANKVWLKFKDAYDTLTDQNLKAKYDSTFKFDDDIPEKEAIKKIKTDKDFFKVFGPVFLKNSIWSTRKPVPKIGDLDTDMKKVKKFYNFWFAFSSWRDFECEGEYNLNEAENRWEKRQMVKENKKLKASMLKDEKARIRRLTEVAYENDPRIIAEESKLQEEREKSKKERAELANKQKSEKEENEKRMKQEYEERKKREAEELIALKNSLYSKLMKLIKEELNLNLTDDEYLAIQINASIDNMKLILNEIEKCSGDFGAKLDKFKVASKSLGLKFNEEKKESSLWTREEISNLQRAVKKFPAGTQNRWEKIMDIVKTKGTNQIIKMSHFLSMNPNMKFEGDTIDLLVLLGVKKEESKEVKEAPKEKEINNKTKNEKIEKDKDNNDKEDTENSKDEWNDTQQKALEAALRKYTANLAANERWTKIASEVPGKNKKQCVERFKYLSQLIKNSNK